MYNFNLYGECGIPSFTDGKKDIPVEQYRYNENKAIYNHLVDRISKQLSPDSYIIRTYKQTSGFAGDQMDVYFVFPLSCFPQGCEEALESDSEFVILEGNKVLYKQVNYAILERLEFGVCNFLMHDPKEVVERRVQEELSKIDGIDFVDVYNIMLQKAVVDVQKTMDIIASQKKRYQDILDKAKATNEYAFAGDIKYGFVDKGRYLEMTVPQALMPHLIGSGGSAIKRVQNIMGKRIKLVPTDAPCYTKRCGWII